jgi:ferredoxin-type protein NapH
MDKKATLVKRPVEKQYQHISSRQKIRRSLLLFLLLLFPMTMNYYSFALPVMGLLEGVICGALLFWALFFCTSLIFGRSGCGYICPLGELQDLWHGAVNRRPKSLKTLSPVKYILSAIWLMFIVWALLQGEKPLVVQMFYLTENVISWDSLYGVFPYTIVLGLVTLSALLLGRRGFCRYFCWYALLNIGGTLIARMIRLPHLSLRANSQQCISCMRCSRNCPMSLPVQQMVSSGQTYHVECILCGTCVDGCPQDALDYSWTYRSKKFRKGMANLKNK